ncbi:MAG TPA: helix-turn-helix domain-containing protein, partial [Saprospiraceae bacterium]|nr:helix-turn-helix domain-containing protein [Saprospiraceae bacterium]
MYKSLNADIKKFTLDSKLHKLHKEGNELSDFGMNNTSELIEGGYGLYSTQNTIKNIGPVKTEYYRIGLTRSGSANFTIGLESFHAIRNTIIFGFPGQIFSFQNPSEDFFNYYMLFSESFISETLLLNNYRNQLPFFSYSGVQCFLLTEEEGEEIENLFIKIDEEIKTKKSFLGQSIRLYIQLIFITANRNYAGQILEKSDNNETGLSLFTRYLKLVSEHFLTYRKVSDYAKMLLISPDHLNRVIKSNSDKTAHDLIDEMIVREAMAYLLYSELSIAEIA